MQRVLVVDDSPLLRRVLCDWFGAEPDFEVVGTASNGVEAVLAARSLGPDVITLDVEMPVQDGLSALEEIMAKTPTTVVVVSSVTPKGAEQTIRALELGAVDFVTKPNDSSPGGLAHTRDELFEKLRAVKLNRSPLTRSLQPFREKRETVRDRVIMIASSTGGPKAVMTLFRSLPHDFPASILIAQHMPAGFTASFAEHLSEVGNMPVKEAKDGDTVRSGTALVAPGGLHLLIGKNGSIELSDASPVHGVRPAADLMFASGASHFGSRSLGVVLTGMGKDGAAGSVEIKKCGGTVLAQEESSCVVYGMPRAAKEAGGIDGEFPIDDMGQALCDYVGLEVRHAS